MISLYWIFYTNRRTLDRHFSTSSWANTNWPTAIFYFEIHICVDLYTLYTIYIINYYILQYPILANFIWDLYIEFSINRRTLDRHFSTSSWTWSMSVRFSLCSKHSSAMSIGTWRSLSVFSITRFTSCVTINNNGIISLIRLSAVALVSLSVSLSHSFPLHIMNSPPSNCLLSLWNYLTQKYLFSISIVLLRLPPSPNLFLFFLMNLILSFLHISWIHHHRRL